MNEFQRLLAYMKILYHNLTTLHRNLQKDEAWFGNHKQLGKWYEEVASEIDDLAETCIALGYKEPTIADAVMLFTSDILSSDARKSEETFRLCFEYFRSVSGMMQAAEPGVPASVTSKLQEYEYFWNKEANFKLASAIGKRVADIDDD